MANWILKFISGKYQGGEFPLEEGVVYGVGRANDSDMVLVEDMVSRNHARLMVQDDVPMLEDLGSTNGSFVNGERVKKVELKAGDRILFGTSIIRLVRADAMDDGLGEPATVPPGLGSEDPVANRAEHVTGPEQAVSTVSSNRTMAIPAGLVQPPVPTSTAPAGVPVAPAPAPTFTTDPGKSGQLNTVKPAGLMAGMLEQVSLPDLLQLFSTGRKSGTLHVQSDGEAILHLRDGRVAFAEIVGADLHPEKAAYRIMTWTTGTFVFDVPQDREFPVNIDMSTEALMMEAMRISDEIEVLRGAPDRNATLVISTPLQPPLRSLTPEILDTLQLVINHGRVGDIIDRSLANDLETMQDLIYLLQHQYVRVG